MRITETGPLSPALPPGGAALPFLRRLHIPALWRVGVGVDGAGVAVGIVDTGCDPEHPFLKDAIVAGKSFVSGELPSAWHDGHGHGTHVAGIVRQVAPGVKIAVARGLNNQGVGQHPDLAAAIDWLREQGVRIISASWGGPTSDSALHEAVAQAVEAGILFVAAAGNDGHWIAGVDNVNYPARWQEPLAVAATGQLVQGGDGVPAPFSSAGPEIDVAAPGTAIISCAPGGGWVEMSGTSMATPMAAGFAALLAHWWYRATGTWPTEPELVTLILSRTRDIAGAGRDMLSGVGEIDAAPLAVRRRVSVMDKASTVQWSESDRRGAVALDVPARIELVDPAHPEKGGRFLAPFRAVGEALGAVVDYDEDLRQGTATLDMLPE